VTVAAAPTGQTPGGASPGPPTASGDAHPVAPQRAPGTDACPLCGTPLSPEQDWCLRCGAAARTRLAATPNWKAPIAVISVVAVLALGVLAAALVKLAGDSSSAPAPVTTTIAGPAATTPAVTTPAAPAVTAPTASVTTPSTTTSAPATTPGGATPGKGTSTGPGAATKSRGAGATAPVAPTTAGKAPIHLTPAQREALHRFKQRAAGK
jgi:hypothetical protein